MLGNILVLLRIKCYFQLIQSKMFCKTEEPFWVRNLSCIKQARPYPLLSNSIKHRFTPQHHVLLKSLDCSQEEARIKKKKRVLILPFSKISKTHTHTHTRTNRPKHVLSARHCCGSLSWDCFRVRYRQPFIHPSIYPASRPRPPSPHPLSPTPFSYPFLWRNSTIIHSHSVIPSLI